MLHTGTAHYVPCAFTAALLQYINGHTSPHIDLFRRNLHHTFCKLINNMELNGLVNAS